MPAERLIQGGERRPSEQRPRPIGLAVSASTNLRQSGVTRQYRPWEAFGTQENALTLPDTPTVADPLPEVFTVRVLA